MKISLYFTELESRMASSLLYLFFQTRKCYFGHFQSQDRNKLSRYICFSDNRKLAQLNVHFSLPWHIDLSKGKKSTRQSFMFDHAMIIWASLHKISSFMYKIAQKLLFSPWCNIKHSIKSISTCQTGKHRNSGSSPMHFEKEN